MAQEPPAQDLMNYEAMAQEALRGVVRAALIRAGEPGGLPGAHHLYLTFKTGAVGVEGPEDLLSRYPDEMTIVLQHQFWDLELDAVGFSVTLKFGGRPQRLTVPYAAMSRFYDPSVQFLLQFEAEATGPVSAAAPPPVDSIAPKSVPEPEPDSPKVISLDQFRKNTVSEIPPETRPADTPEPLTDEAILARFQRTKNQPTGSQTLGFRIVAVSQADKSVEVAFEARAELLLNPMKQIQGGYLCAMLDECMSVACMVASGMTHVAPTAEMKTSFFRPAQPGPIRGVGRVAKWGRTLAFTEGELYDPEGRLLAKATGTAVPTPFKSYKS